MHYDDYCCLFWLLYFWLHGTNDKLFDILFWWNGLLLAIVLTLFIIVITWWPDDDIINVVVLLLFDLFQYFTMILVAACW